MAMPSPPAARRVSSSARSDDRRRQSSIRPLPKPIAQARPIPLRPLPRARSSLRAAGLLAWGVVHSAWRFAVKTRLHGNQLGGVAHCHCCTRGNPYPGHVGSTPSIGRALLRPEHHGQLVRDEHRAGDRSPRDQEPATTQRASRAPLRVGQFRSRPRS